MKALLSLSLFFLLAGGVEAQRRGGGGFGGRVGIGSSGRGFAGRHIGVGASRIGGWRGNWSGWSRGVGIGRGWGGWRGSRFTGHFGYRRGWGGYGIGVGYWPTWGWGFGGGFYSWPGYYDWGWSYPYYPAYVPNVSVVYAPASQPQPVTTTVYVERSRPVMREYDEFGQEKTSSAAKPLYLIAFRDQTIRAAVAYWTDGETLRYVTPQNEQKSVPMADVDREMSLRLNRERRVPFSLQ